MSHLFSKSRCIEMAIQLTFLEKDVEDLIEKESLRYLDIKYVTRQYRTPVGIIDIIAKDPYDSRIYYVVEIKNGPLDASAYVQACRYTKWLNSEMSKDGARIFVPLLIGTKLDNAVATICEYFDSGTGDFLALYGRSYYRIFEFDVLKGVSFTWRSNNEKDHSHSLTHDFNHIQYFERQIAEEHCRPDEPSGKELSELVLVKSDGAA